MNHKHLWRSLDKILLWVPLIIFMIGSTCVFSASARYGNTLENSLAMRQFYWMVLSLGVIYLIQKKSYYLLKEAAMPSYIACLTLLAVVLFMPSRMGAHRWIGLGFLSFQPSEIAKIVTLLMLASFFSDSRWESVRGFKRWQPFLIMGVPFLLILKEPDLGTGLLLIPPFFCMLYLWGFPLKKLLWMFLGVLMLLPVFFLMLKDYQKARLLVFINPNADPLGAGYTIIQSKIAIGSGGWFGKGLLGGTQNKLHFLPESHTDFIFGVLGEEGGFVLTLITLALYVVIFIKGMNISKDCPDRFGSYLALGLTVLFITQVIVNLAMTMGLLPVVGVPLPLVSYGGTSLLVNMMLIGTLLNIKLYRQII